MTTLRQAAHDIRSKSMKLVDYVALLWVGCMALVILLSPFTMLALILHYLFH